MEHARAVGRSSRDPRRPSSREERGERPVRLTDVGRESVTNGKASRWVRFRRQIVEIHGVRQRPDCTRLGGSRSDAAATAESVSCRRH